MKNKTIGLVLTTVLAFSASISYAATAKCYRSTSGVEICFVSDDAMPSCKVVTFPR